LIEVSQLEAAVNMIAAAIAVASSGLGSAPTRMGNRVPEHCPSAVFRCKGEDEWCAIAVRSDFEWHALASALGKAELAADRRFMTHADRKAHEDELEAELAPLIRLSERDELASALQDVGVPASGVFSSRDLLSNEHLRSRGFWRAVTHPVIGAMSYPAEPFRFDGEAVGPERHAPLLGEHTKEVAHSLLGLTDEEIEALVDERVLW
jgi:benzylsuccinate CoA-transferase BbsF subunit